MGNEPASESPAKATEQPITLHITWQRWQRFYLFPLGRQSAVKVEEYNWSVPVEGLTVKQEAS
jgi:hypothetical protein